MFGRRAYFDSAAGWSGNPSSPHAEGRRAKKKLEDARAAIARLAEVQADDVIFTSGATEANALAILGLVRGLRERAGRDTPGRNNIRLLYLSSAHSSVIENMKLAAEEGVSIGELPIKNARVDVEALAEMLTPETALVSMDAVCGETGVVWNTREVAETLRAFRTGVAKNVSAPGRSAKSYSHFLATPVLHVDASQAPLTEKMTRAHFGADLMTLDGAKVAPVHGIGALIAHRTPPAGGPLAPLYQGGGQERGLRPGTEAPELAEEFAARLEQATFGRLAFQSRAARDRERLIAAITSAIPGLFVNESGHAQAPNILNLSLPGRDTDYLVALLDEAGFAVSTRSACETDSEEGSRAVLALTGDLERARATLRISWDSRVRSRDFERLARTLIHSVAFVDKNVQE